jgi:hypothetical protein
MRRAPGKAGLRKPARRATSNDYHGVAERLCEYFPSSGSGQVNLEFHVDG